MGLDQAIESEAQAQAICMQTKDFDAPTEAFAAKRKARFRGGLMADRSFLDWPFFEPPTAISPARSDAGGRIAARWGIDHGDVDAACRSLVSTLGQGGWLQHSAAPARNGAGPVRTLCLTRETLARHDGLGRFRLRHAGPWARGVTLFGTDAQRSGCRARRGAGGDLGLRADRTRRARTWRNGHGGRDGNGWVLDGEKTWISNGGIADVYTVCSPHRRGAGCAGLSAFIARPTCQGLEVAERLETIAPHPLGASASDGFRCPPTR